VWEADAAYHRLFDEGLTRTETVEGKGNKRERHYNLLQLFRLVAQSEGLVAECGCYRGHSAFMLSRTQREYRPEFRGEGFHVFDSFEGLSAPHSNDHPSHGDSHASAGRFQADLGGVQQVLSGFPAITFHKGWIPQSLEALPDAAYRFVHVDLDIYEPTLGALRYFHPRLTADGVIVCDDYGFLAWPGAKRAVDEYAAESGCRVLGLSSGQAVITAVRGRRSS
jgi:hypothetical protein